MCTLGGILLSCSIVAWTALLVAYGQDAQSLGDIARQARQQKQQNNAADTSPPKAARVITDDETPSDAGQAAQTSASDHPTQRRGNSTASAGGKKLSAQEWKERILAQKNLINSTQDKIDKLKASIHFSSYGNVRWNQRQIEKQQQVERLEAQLNDQKKRLEEMQETAKRQGYGNSVYDP
jgi:predicted RNase H-like nuclease (RuvC/YqgF family)